jgi:NADH-quinone oxidoreductase subunit L
LIHAATMVTAGVYMVARSHAIFEQSGVALEVVLWVGALTAVFAATIGLVQTDIKRVLAYSTVSQLGYMFVGLGVSAYAAGIYHLMTHAFFKALLFLGAGSVIHSLRGEQDLRFMGGLAPRMLSTTLTFGVGALAISGVPPFSGFFSKDEILSAVYQSGHRGLWLFLLAGALMTACYTWRLFFLAFSGAPRMSKEVAHHVHESPASMTMPLWALAFLALAASVVGIPLAKGTAIGRFLAPVFPHREEAGHSGALFLLSFLIAVAGITIAWNVFARRPIRPTAIGQPKGVVRRWLVNKYYVDELYDVLFVRSFHTLANFCARRFDLGLIDGIVNGVGRLVVNAASRWRLVQTGYAMNYALGMLVGAVAIIAVLFLKR